MARAIIAVQAKKKTIWYEKWRLLSESSIFISITAQNRKKVIFCQEETFIIAITVYGIQKANVDAIIFMTYLPKW